LRARLTAQRSSDTFRVLEKRRLKFLYVIDPRENKQDFHDWKRDLGIPNDNTDKNFILKYLEELLGHPPKK
jgi:hypothetical protein